MTTGTDDKGPYHRGELALQTRAGTRERAEIAGQRGIRDQLLDQHREFFNQLPFIVAAAMDDDGQPWASLLAGPPGFITAPTPQYLEIAEKPADADPLAGLLAVGRPVGLLGIDQQKRRRNRLNGIVTAVAERQLTVGVRQSYGNCPKYIQARKARYVGSPSTLPECRRSEKLDAGARRLIAAADTFFIASAHPEARTAGKAAHGIDVSHRGGPPGFVRIDDDGTLAVPDFVGNGFFNTLGNLELHPRAGLLFVDFAGGGLLHIAAEAEIIFDRREVEVVAGGQRLLRLFPRHVIHRDGVLPLAWEAVTPGP